MEDTCPLDHWDSETLDLIKIHILGFEKPRFDHHPMIFVLEFYFLFVELLDHNIMSLLRDHVMHLFCDWLEDHVGGPNDKMMH